MIYQEFCRVYFIPIQLSNSQICNIMFFAGLLEFLLFYVQKKYVINFDEIHVFLIRKIIQKRKIC